MAFTTALGAMRGRLCGWQGGTRPWTHGRAWSNLAATTKSTTGISSSSPSPPPPPPTTPADVLSLLRSQPAHYAVVRLYQRCFLVRPHDIVTVPRIKSTGGPHASAAPPVGARLALTKVEEVGSRDFTWRVAAPSPSQESGSESGQQVPGGLVRPLQSGLRSQAKVVGRPSPVLSSKGLVPGVGGNVETNSLALPSEMIKVYATVLEHTRGKLVALFKKKRRKGYQRTIKIKPAWTKLRIDEIDLGKGHV